ASNRSHDSAGGTQLTLRWTAYNDSRFSGSGTRMGLITTCEYTLTMVTTAQMPMARVAPAVRTNPGARRKVRSMAVAHDAGRRGLHPEPVPGNSTSPLCYTPRMPMRLPFI